MNDDTKKLANLPEDERKGVIFTYFVGATWVVIAILTIQNFYLALTLQGEIANKYADYTPGNIGSLIFFGLIWWGHRWYPKIICHIFLLTIVAGAIFFFKLEDLDRIFVALTLPIIMAAFLIQPLYSFVYLIFIACTYIFRFYLEGFFITNEEFSFVGLISLIVIAVVAWLIAQSLERALAETRTLNKNLDQRVQERTLQLRIAVEQERMTAIRNTTILESIADGVLVFDANQQVIIANPAANQLANRNLQFLPLFEILSNTEEKARETVKAWIKGQKPADRSNVKFEWYERIISATIAPVPLVMSNEEQIDTGTVMVLRDFTKETELERAKDLFLGTVSHELRTPMSAIQGYVDVLLTTEKGYISEAGYEHLQTIDTSIKQLLKLANELIDVSRIETGRIDLYCQWVDLTTVINNAARIVRQEFASRKLNLDLKFTDNLPKLYLDRNRMLQVLLNLLSNAYKYTVQGGATVEVTQSDKWVHITVVDTGVGIKEVDQARMFNRFFRANDKFVQKTGGTGLGLNISKGLTELHGGKLTFESKYGVGTTFRIILPKNGATPSNNNSEA